MKDLIVIISASRCNAQNRVVFRIWQGKIKILKAGILSANKFDTDLTADSPYNNCSKEDAAKIYETLKKPSSIKLLQKFYSISGKSFSEIKDILSSCQCFFSESIKKKNKVFSGEFLINKIIAVKSDKFSISRNEDILTVNYVEEDNVISENESLPFKVFVPQKQLYILNEDKHPFCRLQFVYGNIIIDGSSQEQIIQDCNTKYLRNKGEEEKAFMFLSSLGFVRKEKHFQYKGKKPFLSVAEKLLENDFMLFDTGGQSVKSSKVFSVNISYGIDWFGVNFKQNGNELSNFIYENLNLNSNYFEFNGQKYLVPEVLQEAKDSLQVQDGKLVIKKDNWLSALEMSTNLDRENLVKFENLFVKNSGLTLTEKQKKILRPYQVEGINFLERLKSNGFGALLADDMGLGKTLQAITFLCQTQRKTCAFVVVPKSLLENWKNEIAKFASILNVLVYHGTGRKENPDFEEYDIVLSTYSTTMLDIDLLSKKKFSAIVFDEVQTIKNFKSKMYEAAFKLKADFKMALSGTPFENNVLELWAIMRLLNPKIFSKRAFFTKAIEEKSFDKIKTAIAPFILQRTKNDVLNDLPEKTEEIIYCSMDEDMSSCYAALHAKINAQLGKEAEKATISFNAFILQSLLKLRLFCCHPKLLPNGVLPINLDSSAKFDVLKIKVKALVDKREKIIIFSQFTSMLGIIKDWLAEAKIKTFYLDGQTEKRQDIVDEFEKSGEGVFLISLKAGGVGLNLVSCHYMFIYDPWWNPAAENQAADRIYRIGQRNNVFVYRLITKGTIEEKVIELKAKKQEIAQALFTGLSSEKMTADDFIELLR